MDGQWEERQIIVEKGQESFYKLAEQLYKQGARNGLCREFYPKRYGGGLRKEAVYLDDKINGANKFYFQNGQLASVEHFLPEYAYRSLNPNEDSPFKFPINIGTQVKHGEFLGYFEDGNLRHRITYKENVPVGECEIYYRLGKKEYHTEGSFKDGDYFEGTFIYWEKVKNPGYGRQLPYHDKFWILHYHQGSLTEKELIIDTSKDPLLPPRKKKKWPRKRLKKKG